MARRSYRRAEPVRRGYSRRVRSAQQILADSAVIAVVGASRDPSKAAHRVPAEMRRYGWRIIPVNPTADELFGEPVYRSLADIPHPVDLVDVFRPADEAVDVARQAVAIGAPAVWLQLGIVSPQARQLAEEAGLDYVENRCLIVERAAANLTRLG
ncbi:succinyl-CoA ligase subunit alpha [Micromonospora endophytica]|nr:succinyl-CoA ligase subunit alpha [Micromonospora endophytica]